jgi:hypothetical protein
MMIRTDLAALLVLALVAAAIIGHWLDKQIPRSVSPLSLAVASRCMPDVSSGAGLSPPDRLRSCTIDDRSQTVRKWLCRWLNEFKLQNEFWW